MRGHLSEAGGRKSSVDPHLKGLPDIGEAAVIIVARSSRQEAIYWNSNSPMQSNCSHGGA